MNFPVFLLIIQITTEGCVYCVYMYKQQVC